MSEIVQRIDGVVIGAFLGFNDAGVPLVVFSGNPRETAVPAKSLTELGSDMIGAEVALLFEAGEPERPLIVGRVVDPVRAKPAPEILRDGKRVRVVAGERIELRCGKAAVILEKDGRIVVRGTNLLSHASGANRIRGGSIDLN